MKHLKKFNESKSEIFELAKDSMVDLMDNGFQILLRDNEIWILPDSDRCFNWSEVENYIIKFLSLQKVNYLSIDYQINQGIFHNFTIIQSEIIDGTINKIISEKVKKFNKLWNKEKLESDFLISVIYLIL